MSSQSLSYQLCNLIGAVCIFYSLIFNFNLSSFAIETAWIIISLIGIRRILTARNKSKTEVSNIIRLGDVRKVK